MPIVVHQVGTTNTRRAGVSAIAHCEIEKSSCGHPATVSHTELIAAESQKVAGVHMLEFDLENFDHLKSTNSKDLSPNLLVLFPNVAPADQPVVVSGVAVLALFAKARYFLQHWKNTN